MRGSSASRISLTVLAAIVAVSLGGPLAGDAAAGETTTLSGVVVSVHTDYLSQKKSGPARYYLKTRTGKRYKLDPERSVTAHVGDQARLTGTTDGSSVNVDSASYSQSTAVADNSVSKKVAVILFNFDDQTTQPWTESQARGYIFTNSDSTNEYFKEQSSNTLSLTGKVHADGDVYPTPAEADPQTGYHYYQLPYSSSGSCNWTTWASKARQMAEAAGNDLSGYDHYIYASPNTPACGFGGVAYMPGSVSYLDGSLNSLRTSSHELSHNLGVHHSATMDCGSQPLPVTYTDYSNTAVNPLPSGCNYSEYGDPFDVMGAASRYQLGNQHKGNLELQTGATGFLSGTTQTVTQDGIYTLQPSEPGPLKAGDPPFTGTQVLRLPRMQNPTTNAYSYYYLDFRQPYGSFDTFAATNPAISGVTIRAAGGYGSHIQTRLVDTTPTVTTPNGNFYNAPLTVGSSYTFPDTGVTIKTLSVSASGAQVQVGDITGAGGLNGSELLYSAPPNSASDVTISTAGGVTTLTDRGVGSIPAGSGCQATADPQTITCAGASSVRAELGDGDDTVSGAGSALNLTLNGGAGDDTLLGGTGDDTLIGGLGTDQIDGLGGLDKADYSDHTAKLKIDLDGKPADDGQSGEHDTIGADVEGIVGGSNKDKLNGNGDANVLDGGAGDDQIYGSLKPSDADAADTILGGAGNDKLLGGNGDDTIHGGVGKDMIRGDGGIDYLFGDEGRNVVSGNAGDDRITSIADPDGFGDVLKGGSGVDTLSTADGDERDKLSCGDGSDVVNADQFDDVSATDCE